MKKKNPLNVDTEKIKYDWGSVKRFCRENGIGICTYKVVKAGNGKSKRVENILKKYGYLR